jgi:hypothetical protein
MIGCSGYELFVMNMKLDNDGKHPASEEAGRLFECRPMRLD